MPRELMRDEPFWVTEVELAELPENRLLQCDKEAAYQIRPTTQAKIRELRRQFTRRVPNKRSHQMEDEFDGEGYADALLDFVLVDWKGVTSQGEPVPCTSAHKPALDMMVKSALITRAALNRVAADAAKEQSFRGPADVRADVG